jgi:tetratricopeptide (TPR) repeat protein
VPAGLPLLLGLAAAATAAETREAGARSPAVLLDVPYLPQAAHLCGGAAAAMVLRYWGAADVHPEDFAPLVDAARGGIAGGALADAVRRRGWRALAFRGTREEVQAQLGKGRPVIGLIRVAPRRHHYVVFVGWSNGRVLLHDPAFAPFRVEGERRLLEAWKPTEHWALLILPAAAGQGRTPEVGEREGESAAAPNAPEEVAAAPPLHCDRLTGGAVELARANDLAGAEARLNAALALCPEAAGPLRELAGVRFKQKRYADAAQLAQRAARIAEDELTWRLLATSRFLAGDAEAALAAWNRIGEPRLDRLHIAGLSRTRQDVVKSWLSLEPRTLLTPAGLRRAERRLAELPTLSAARLSLEPLGSGRFDVRASAVERPLFEPLAAWLPRAVVDAAVHREVRLVAASPTRSGEALAVGGRFWAARPAAWLSATQPRALGLPGVTTLEAAWDEQTYAVAQAGAAGVAETLREERLRAAVSSSHWISADLWLRLSLGVERFAGTAEPRARGSFGSVAAYAERRAARDRLAFVGEAAFWSGGGADFGVLGARLLARSTSKPARTVVRAGLAFERASSRAPLAVWQGAGTGRGRAFLLRAHPLLVDGRIAGPAFGRALVHGGVEVERQIVRGALVGVGAVAFVDWARATRRLTAPAHSGGWSDGGIGVRLHGPARAGSLRLDLAAPLGSSGWRVSAGWVGRWPDRPSR